MTSPVARRVIKASSGRRPSASSRASIVAGVGTWRGVVHVTASFCTWYSVVSFLSASLGRAAWRMSQSEGRALCYRLYLCSDGDARHVAAAWRRGLLQSRARALQSLVRRGRNKYRRELYLARLYNNGIMSANHRHHLIALSKRVRCISLAASFLDMLEAHACMARWRGNDQ